jgi:hypothetical protein
MRYDPGSFPYNLLSFRAIPQEPQHLDMQSKRFPVLEYGKRLPIAA